MVSLILGSGDAMFTVWGAQRSLLYNDACIPVVGAEHPKALGGPMHTAWPGVWDIIAPIIERAFAGNDDPQGGAAALPAPFAGQTLNLQCDDGLGPTCLSFTCHPFRDESGAVVGVLFTGRETRSTEGALLRWGSGAARKWQSLDQAPGFVGMLDQVRSPDKDHSVSAVFAQGYEVAALLQSQEQLRAANARYAALLDSMGEGLVMLDTEFRVLAVNARGLHLDGRTAQELTGRVYWDVWPGSVGTAIEHCLRSTLASNEPRHLQHRYHWQNSRALWFDLHMFPVPGGLAVLFRNISKLKQADETLHASKERFKAAVSAIGIMWTNTAQGQMEGEQPGWAEITGQTQAQYQGFGWADALHPDDAGPTLQTWQRAMVEQRNYEFEHRVRRRDGQWRRYAVRAVPVLTADGVLREWVGVHIDVTEARQDAEALRAADQRKDEFLAVLAHELRNPLAPIRSAAQVLGNPGLTPQELTACRDIIHRQTRHMAWLLDDLLDVSRITAGRLELKKSYIRLSDVVAAAVETARPVLDARGHTLEIDLQVNDIEIEVDDLRLSQVLSNLLVNAAKYTDGGGHVSLIARADENGLLIEVQDDGIGIGAEQLKQVFVMFSQLRTETDRTQGGLGIGLALSKGLVELHGGRLEARSPGLGQGATFSVHLPADLMDSRPALLDESAATGAAASARVIMIADDNADAAQTLAMLLSLEGHEVHVASNGQAALALAARIHPHVAILDIGMPILDGHEVARLIRLEAWGTDMLVMAVTGWGQQEDQRRAHAAGFDCHFTKPVDPTVLIDRIAAWRGKQDPVSPGPA